MAVIRALPRAIGGFDAWFLIAGASKLVAVQSDDGDTAYIGNNTAGDKKQSFFMDSVTGLLVSVSSVTLAVKSRHTTSGTAPWTACYIKQSATETFLFNTNSTGAYALNTGASGTSALGAAWTPAIVDLTEGELFSQTPDDSPSFFVTWMYFDVTGVPFAGGLAQLIATLGPLVAVGLHEMPKLIRHLARISVPRRILIEPHEVALAWREMREDRHPRHFLMPVGVK